MKKWRVDLIFIVIILFGAAVIGRLFYLQVFRYDFYKALAHGQQKNFQLLKGNRGHIFFNGGEILATNTKAKYVFISPKKIINKEETAGTLSRILNLEEDFILERIKKDTLYEQIKINLTEEEKIALAKLSLTGVYLDEITVRNYPQGTMASQAVGFVGGEGFGQYGIEGYYDEILQGKEFFQKGEKSSKGYFFSEIDERTANGTDVFLTFDYNIQFTAEKLLEKAKKELEIESGLILVMEPNSGKILALANFPNYDPNYYSQVKDFQIFQNGTIQKFYEPGSAFKPITMASALDREKITPQTTYIDEGKVKIGGYTIFNYDQRIWGERTMNEVLEKSINTGAVFAEKQVGHEDFLEYIKKFGFFGPTGIDLQGEVFSENQELKKGYEINFATASFGQGIEITPIQLARAFSAIANGGKLIKPYIVEKILKDGKAIETKPEIFDNQIISPKTVSQLTAMLVSVVENGSGKLGKIPGYYTAGKTGTAQVPEKGTYSSDKTWQSFVGFTPAFNARFLVLIKLDNPKTKTSEYSAAPIFNELAKYITDYLQIPPDYE